MRILLDEAKLGWDQAWDITRRALAYTKHTLLPGALEKWPVKWSEHLLPRHLEIIYEINRRADMFPQRFSNKTNGVTPRRWLLLANRALARVITEAIGDGWIVDLGKLGQLKPLAEDSGFRDAFRNPRRLGPHLL